MAVQNTLMLTTSLAATLLALLISEFDVLLVGINAALFFMCAEKLRREWSLRWAFLIQINKFIFSWFSFKGEYEQSIQTYWMIILYLVLHYHFQMWQNPVPFAFGNWSFSEKCASDILPNQFSKSLWESLLWFLFLRQTVPSRCLKITISIGKALGINLWYHGLVKVSLYPQAPRNELSKIHK